ncbi:MAG: excinuclease ABC subunit UvrA [Verrucomicrobiales bacterium]|nr:excinuclease ABC subunit UvrA [Verrucomicrobiales bacterium]
MSPPPRLDVIRVRGARQNNLKAINLDLPTRKLVVITGLSGSGKSSLAFDTLYAEGQRRYIETFSPYARQFFDRMDKPRVDAIEGIPPAIALEQRNNVRTTRSTVGTMTEITDYLKLSWPHVSVLHCRQCAAPVAPEPPAFVWSRLSQSQPAGSEILVTFNLPLTSKLSLAEQLSLITRQGFQRAVAEGVVHRLDTPPESWTTHPPSSITIVQDRLRLSPGSRTRFVDACEQAYHFGHGRLRILLPGRGPSGSDIAWTVALPFSRHLHCASCDIEYAPPSPALFSFNHPIGACPNCKGFGRVIGIDYDLAIPDRSRSLAEGAVKPWQTGTGAESQADLTRAARECGVPMDVPFQDLPESAQRWVIEGDPEYGEGNEWPRAWYGLKGYFRYLESKAYKMHVRVLLSRYRSYHTCPACQGRRLKPDALLWKLPADLAPQDAPGELSVSDLCQLPIQSALGIVEQLQARHTGPAHDPIAVALAEVRSRLSFLVEVGVGYLTLHRPTRSLSGGETQRVTLTTCLGSRLVHTLFVLDEPSVGLHPRDTHRLVRILQHLRDQGNTVLVVEHDPIVMRAADQIIDVGPGHGDQGGQIVAQGTFEEILQHPSSLTGAYLSGRRSIPPPHRRAVILTALAASAPPAPSRGRARSSPKPPRRVAALEVSDAVAPYTPRVEAPAPVTPHLVLEGVTRHNLRQLRATIPLTRLVCLTGVSGSGKTTLAEELLRLLRDQLGDAVSRGSLGARESEADEEEADDESTGPSVPHSTRPQLHGAHQLESVLLVDQAPIGRTPRSNPAVYTGAFEPLRELFAASDAARKRGLTASSFSFNSAQGQCEQCRGAGFEKIEMQFLSDIFIRCSSCEGRRYRPHILEVQIPVPTLAGEPKEISIADLLEMTIDDAIALLAPMDSPHAARARQRLTVLQEVGLGYLRLGQPVNTLSGGESQRLKLAGHLAESSEATLSPKGRDPAGPRTRTLFIFDEPTTGLHTEDVRILLLAFQRLVDAGHSVLIIEHNLEVMKCADWIIDLGPEAGAEGGRVVVAGPPEAIAACPESHTGRALRLALSE